jgi:hypothetical protein
MRRLFGILARRIRENLDLIILWVGLVVAQPLIPVDHYLARDDLTAWLMLTLSLTALLRARHLGSGPHPMLTQRRAPFGALTRRVALVLVPWLLLAWYLGAWSLTPSMMGTGFVLLLVVIVLLSMGRKHGLTAWNPPGSSAGVGWFAYTVFMALILAMLGWLCGAASLPWIDGSVLPGWMGMAGMVGIGFLSIGLLAGRARNRRQRKTAGRRDGKPYRPDLFQAALALFGPSVGLALLYQILGGLMDFSQAYAGALYVVVWAAVLWQRPDPIARACVLHEVVPSGGGDKEAKASALSFDRPPEGALRFNPIRTKRILVMHPWLVPVRQARIEKLDDPVRPLWAQHTPLLPHHILGEACFEPDPITRATQWDVLTIKMGARTDVSTVAAEDAKTRRIAILRAYPRGFFRRRKVLTYRWEEKGLKESIQVIDATTERATLMDGDLLVLSAEGVARAFEVELGAPLYSTHEFESFRAPQLEDYVKVG